MPKPKKVLHIIIGLNVGGAELMLKRLVLHSHQKGEYQHEVISLTDLGVVGSDLRKQGISVYTLGMTSILKLPIIFLKLKNIIKQIDPDVVQTWMYHADFLGGIAAKHLGIKKIIWGIRTTDVTKGSSKLTVILRSICAKLSYNVPTDIICAAHISRDIHVKVGYDPTKMHVIPNGFEINKLVATEQDRNNLRKELNIPKDALVIGSVGRFNVVKNQKFFVEVASILVKNYPNLIFMLVGRDNTNDNVELMDWINQYNLSNNFRLLGQRKDIPICLKTMDIFCLHSKTEGFPNVLGEAVALKVFSVSTDVGDVKYLLSNENILSSDIKTYSNYILSVIHENKYKNNLDLWNQYHKFSKKFSIENCVLEFERIYDF